MTLTHGILLIAAAALGTPAAAQSLSCKNDFTQLGDSKAAVLLKCGEPIVKDSFCKPAVAGSVAPVGVIVRPCETVEEWTYKPGYGQFMTTLRFEAGRLSAVTYGDRVR